MKKQLIQALLKITSKRKLTPNDLLAIADIKDLIRMEMTQEMWIYDKYCDIIQEIRKRAKPLTPSEKRKLKKLETFLGEKLNS